MPMWFTNSRVCVPSSPCILRAFLLNVSYAPSLFICQTWFHFFTYFPFFACFTCLHFYIYLTYPQYLRAFISFSSLKCLPSFLRVLRALIFLRVFIKCFQFLTNHPLQQAGIRKNVAGKNNNSVRKANQLWTMLENYFLVLVTESNTSQQKSTRVRQESDMNQHELTQSTWV